MSYSDTGTYNLSFLQQLSAISILQIWCHDIQHNGTQQKGLICDSHHESHSAYMTLNKTFICHYAESHDLCIVMLNVVMLSVVTLNVVAPANLFRKYECKKVSYYRSYQTFNQKCLAKSKAAATALFKSLKNVLKRLM